MTPQTVKYFDWFKDLEPEILKNLNSLLVAEKIEPLRDLHGGSFKDGKWVSPLESNDYRNYWHVYLEIWGEHIRNDSYDEVWFPNINDDEAWDYLYKLAEKFAAQRHYEHSDPKWPRHLVTAVRKMLRDNGFCTDPNGESLLIWWSW